ncbi:HAD family hydrolase [Pseudonocardia acaciae]|uniref:HAD family hydrolase n=1 Tax=Pseudonocardia acaciae TaxID=551276 RepID=UPI0006850EDB|nr:HAD family hydrolase [Pseudonocardia acaciae]
MTAPERTRARRPKVVLLDVFETLLRLSALRPRFVDVGRPERELELFFARTLRDGMALTLAGGSPPFTEVARSALIGTTGRRLSEEAVQHVLAGLSELPPHPDVEPALITLARARVPAYAFTHGSADVVRQALDRAQLRSYLRGVLSAEEIGSFKPPATVYHWACKRVGSEAARTALVSVHPWDVHGAVRAGLLAGFATRQEGGMSDVFDAPHVVAETLDVVVERLLAQPA